MKRFKYISIILLALSVTACGNDPQDVSEENFKTAINRNLAHDPICIKISGIKGAPILDRFDFPELFEIRSWERQSKGQKENIIQMFVEAGLVKAETGEFERKNPLNGRSEKINARHYSLTDRGNEVFKDNGFCYGLNQVVEIINYTEPTEQMGQSTVQVQYSFAPEITEDWIREEGFKSWVDEVEKKRQSPEKSRQTLMLTKKGWFGQWDFR